MEQKTPPQRFSQKGRERYLRMHKRMVGPKTAERLFLLYGELKKGSTPSELYSAGWAIAEASLAGTHLPADTRRAYVDQAEISWVRAMQLQQSRATLRAERKGITPDRTAEYRIATALATVPILAELPYGKPQRRTMEQFHETLILTAKLNATDMVTAQKRQLYKGANNHEGLGYEHLAQLSISRLRGRRLFACPAFARSDNGSYYPSQTHDIQILHLDRGEITAITPTEVKRSVREDFFERYKDVSLLSGLGMTQEGEISIPRAIRLFEREQQGVATDTESTVLRSMTESVIHSMRHYQRPERYGRHCLQVVGCQAPSLITPEIEAESLQTSDILSVLPVSA